MNIKSVKLKSSGFHGAAVEYFIEEVKGNRKSNTLIKKYPKDPIQKDLEHLFKDLRPHLLDICQMNTRDESEMKFVTLETEVTGIDFDSDGFTLHGEREVFGNKSIKLNTPKVEEIDNYEGYEEVNEIIKNIISETKLYLEGEKKVTDDELVERWVESGRDKVMTKDAWEGLSSDEKRDYSVKFLENEYGAVVMLPSEMSSEAPVVEEEQTFVIGGDEEVVIPVSKKGPKAPPKEQEEEAF